ncbi:MAG: hypothetical protein KGS45_07785 [Planctomycetes bacterium]|nr:hypothetical protein [Planctomycetota bacterium]
MAKKAKKKAAKKVLKKKAAKKAVKKGGKNTAAKKKTAKKKGKRTTLYSSKGKKLYAVRNADGSFKDIQTYQRAHAADMRQTSAAEASTEATAG